MGAAAMTHLPYIAAAYALCALVLAALSLGAWRRHAAARRLLARLDPRA